MDLPMGTLLGPRDLRSPWLVPHVREHTQPWTTLVQPSRTCGALRAKSDLLWAKLLSSKEK